MLPGQPLCLLIGYITFMKSTPELEEYRRFLVWFEIHHPQLNKDYWQYITVPKPGEGVKVMNTGLDPAIFDKLEQIKYDYYHC